MLKRGRRDVGPPGFSSTSRWRGRVNVGLLLLLSLPLLLVSEDPEVVEGPGGPLISVVETFGVLVMVGVVVVSDDADSAAVSEKDGSTKLSGASAGLSPPLMNITAAMRTPMTATPAALAPSTASVELCHGVDGSSPPNSSTNSASSNPSSRSARATASDVNPPTCGNARSTQLSNHLGGEQVQVIEVRHIQKLQVNPLHTDLGERAELVDDLVWRARQR
jgi:hypothetical protein